MSTYITVFGNIFKNLFYLKSDFLGLSINPQGMSNFFLIFLFAVFLITIYYLIGNKTRNFILKKRYSKFDIFIDLALGYIFVNSGVALLGLSSLLYKDILLMYIGLITLIAFLPYGKSNLKGKIADLLNATKEILWKKKLIFIAVYLFVLIAFIRLIPPETGEDAMGYHTGDPRLFLNAHSTIVKIIVPPFVMPAPHLGEMSYVLSEAVGLRDSARYNHFFFYVFVVSLITTINPYAGLFFVTAPVVIQVSSKANIDFQWILCWLLSILLIAKAKKITLKDAILAGILFGGVLATKMWTIAFVPLFVLYFLFFNQAHFGHKLKLILIFILFAFLIDFIWIWRSFIISGNPLYPMFSKTATLGEAAGTLELGNVLGFNKLMFGIQNIKVFSPLLYLSALFFVFDLRRGIKLLRKLIIAKFFTLLVLEYLMIRYHFGRYLLGLYSLGIFIISINIRSLMQRVFVFKIIFVLVYLILFIYYFVNALLVLPYGFGWADNNKYLTRIIFKDNTNYYDFGHQFSKWITNKDKVATYGIYGYYYASFDYIDINYIFDKDNKSFDLLTERNVTKLLVKGGNILWFCEKLNLDKCSSDKVELLVSYPEEIGKIYLYNILKPHKIAIEG